MSDYKKMEAAFKGYSAEYYRTENQIIDTELADEIPDDSLYEKCDVLWDNIDVLLARAVRLGYVKVEEAL
jgi:hypothetical protein